MARRDPATDQSASRTEARALVRRLLDAAYARDVDRIVTLYAEDAVAVSPVFGEVSGRAAVGETWRRVFSILTDPAIEVSDILVDGERIAVLSTFASTFRAGWFGRPATGGRVQYRLVLLLTVRDGRIVRDERLYDSTGVLERLEKARLDKELQTAAEVQRALMSRTEYVGPFCHAAGNSAPCRAIGGDFFDLFPLPSGAVGLLMGDVAGKGPPAALLAALIQGMFAADVSAGSPADVLSRINRRLVERGLASRFATLVYGVLSSDGEFVYSNAGHNAPLLVRGGEIQRLGTGGPIVGMFAEAAFENGLVRIHDGDLIVMFTDGVSEARNTRDEEFGEERLLAAVRAERSGAPPGLVGGIFGRIREFCEGTDQNDDITLIVARFRGA